MSYIYTLHVHYIQRFPRPRKYDHEKAREACNREVATSHPLKAITVTVCIVSINPLVSQISDFFRAFTTDFITNKYLDILNYFRCKPAGQNYFPDT